MKSLVALGWRFLLAFALVANPLASAAMACHEAPAPAPRTESASPPCHEHLAAQAVEAAAKPAPSPHGHDCAKAGCDFASCCASFLVAAGFAPPAAMLPAHDVGHAEGARALAGPPLPPLIRPPIA